MPPARSRCNISSLRGRILGLKPLASPRELRSSKDFLLVNLGVQTYFLIDVIAYVTIISKTCFHIGPTCIIGKVMIS